MRNLIFILGATFRLCETKEKQLLVNKVFKNSHSGFEITSKIAWRLVQY